MQKARVSREETMSTIRESSHVLCEQLSHHSHLQSECYYVHHLYTMASSSTVITTTTTTVTTACSCQLRRGRSRRWIVNKLLEFALQCGLALLGPLFIKNATHEYSAISPPPWTVAVLGISILVTLCAGIGSVALRGLRGPPSFLPDFLHFVTHFSAMSAFASFVSTALGGRCWWISYAFACFPLAWGFHHLLLRWRLRRRT